jgi:hypothetical protein
MHVAVNEKVNPPYVKFEVRSFEDRKASMETGKYTARDVDYVVIRQAGNQNTSEFEAQEWLARISKNPGYKPEWVQLFRNQYAEWKKGYEPTPYGTHVRNWPVISPAQADMLTQVQVLTVEDLATANEATLQRIGMGGRALQLKAKAWLDSAKKIGSVAEELASLREMNKALLEQNNLLREQNHSLQIQAGVKVQLAEQPQAKEVDPFG